MKIILDTNIWISFLLGKRLSLLRQIIENPNIQIYISPQLLEEIIIVSQRPKFKNKISAESVSYLFDLINNSCRLVNTDSKVGVIVRDLKDIFLLSMAQDIPADYLITGDKDLLVIEEYKECHIVQFSDFLKILSIF